MAWFRDPISSLSPQVNLDRRHVNATPKCPLFPQRHDVPF
jgi:hypothetical protein